jgi:MFS family permease
LSTGWAPLRTIAFRWLWTAQFSSNVGSWMQTVAAQWLMVSLTTSGTLVGAVQTAASLPVFLLAIPAGVAGDLVDRRRLILVGQMAMLIASAGLGVAALAGIVTPWLLLVSLATVGAFNALTAPTWQSATPELVPPSERTQAIALGSVSMNLARAIGPAIGGLLLAATSAGVVFLANGLTYFAVVGAVAAVALPRRELTGQAPPERAFGALRAGGRYVANAPALRALLIRAVAFVLPAGSVWALLPLVAKGTLGLGSSGYGLLLASVGLGALLGASFAPPLRDAVSWRMLVTVCSLVVGAVALALALSGSVVVDATGLVLAGGAWITALGLLNSSFQAALPGWVKARGLAYYLVAFQGANALGALLWGAVAEATSVRAALLVLAAALVLGTAATWPLRVVSAGSIDVRPAEPLAVPDLASTPPSGPVLVTISYYVADGQDDAFLACAPRLRHSRGRTGGYDWRLFGDPARPGRYVETFLVGSWDEHVRQHARRTIADAALTQRIDGLLRAGTAREVHHLVRVAH